MATSRPAWWSNRYAEQAVSFFRSLTLCGDYTGQKWDLEPFQDELLRELYGKRRPDGTRQTTTVSLWMPRGMGKTQLAGGIALYELAKGARDREIYAGAPDRDKASRLYWAMAKMCRDDPWLDSHCECSDYHLRIRVPSTGSTFQALAADTDQGHSLAPSTLVCDELHLWRNAKLYTALKSGFHKRKAGSTLEVQISTAGDQRRGLAWDLYSYAKSIKEGRISDPKTLVRIFEATAEEVAGDGWRDPELWRRVMPCRFVNFDQLAEDAEKAAHIKHLYYAFLQLYLGIWVEDHGDCWIAPGEWRACEDAEPYDAADLAGETCFAALDLSSNRDLTSLSLFFPESRRTLSHSWLPMEDVAQREERDGVPYREWERLGLLSFCKGSRIVHEEVAEEANEILSAFDVARLVADPYHILLIDKHLSIEVEKFRQHPTFMSPPTRWLESAIAERTVRHNGDALLAWAIENVVVVKDQYENVTPHKKKSRKRIDPAVSLVMAIGAWLGGGEAVDVNAMCADKSNLIF